MSKKRRRAKIPTPTWERPRGALGRRVLGRPPRFYATVGLVALVVIAVGIVGFAYFADYRADQQRPGSTALQIDDTKYTLRYFTQRLQIYVQQSGGAANEQAQPILAIPAVVEQLQQEATVLRFAGELGVSASEDEIRAQIAGRIGLEPEDPAYDARYQEELARSSLTEDEYRSLTQAAVLTDKLRDQFETQVPATAESAHYRQILVSEQTAADDIVQQVRGGADFAQLAAALSLDPAAKDIGGDGGWVPRGVLDKALEDTLFGLEVGGLTSIPVSSGVFVLQLLEKVKERAIEPDQRPSLAQQLLADWLQEKRQGARVVNHMDLDTGDPDKINWAVRRAYQI